MGYFRYVPNLQYIARDLDNNSSLNYSEVKNLFKRIKIREDILHNLVYFTKYQIIGDERPDNIAHKIYNDPDLDWVVLLSNNIINVYEEWPMTQNTFNNYIAEKYGSYENAIQIKHYETKEVRDSSGSIVLQKGLVVNQNFSFRYYDSVLGESQTVTNITKPVSFLEYEENIENNKRNIYLIKQSYLNLILDDTKRLMLYTQSSDYVNESLKKVSNIRLS